MPFALFVISALLVAAYGPTTFNVETAVPVPLPAATSVSSIDAKVMVAQSAPVAPLNQRELAAVLEEIRRMVKTDANDVPGFVVNAATPERIDRLAGMPEFLQESTTIRENALIFAGQGRMLSFEKPSDISRKLSTWFPEEIRAAQADKEQRFFGHIHLYGPFPNWEDEPSAFLALWNCMPQIAWLKPERSPFVRRLNESPKFYGAAAMSSGELDFGTCVRERSGRRAAWTDEQHRANLAEQRTRWPTIENTLKGKFARFLSANRCQGRGPDDCVLVLLLWASLSPEDPALAAAIRGLEAEAAPDGALPPLRQAIELYDKSVVHEGEARFDEALRKAAFLRAKLASVLAAPDAWPARATETVFHQTSALGQRLAAEIGHRWHNSELYELSYRNEHVNPWGLLSANTKPSCADRCSNGRRTADAR